MIIRSTKFNHLLGGRVKRLPNKTGFSFVELFIVMAVIGLILSIAIPNFRAMQQEGELSRCEEDLDTLKVAVTSYWRNNAQTFPADIHTTLTAATPSVITKVLTDPWESDVTHHTYGYLAGKDATFGSYYFLYTKGPTGDTAPTWDAQNQRVIYRGSGRVVSNAPVVRE